MFLCVPETCYLGGADSDLSTSAFRVLGVSQHARPRILIDEEKDTGEMCTKSASKNSMTSV